jgi:nitrate/nitrite transporter NarK
MSTPNQWRALALLSLAELFGMALWFSGSAVVPALSHEWNLSASQVSWLANAVQFGFVAGTQLSSKLNHADIITTRHL